MELVLENGWYGSQWMGDHMAPRADVVEDKDAYHFYVEMPGLKDGSIDVQVEDDRLMVASERKRPEWPQEAGFISRSGTTALSDAYSGFRPRRAATASARPMLTAYSN